MIRTPELLHELVDDLSNDQLATTVRYLQQLRDGTPRPSLEEVLANASYDDEPLTDEDIAAIEEGYADIAAGRGYTTDEVRRRVGLSPIENR